jgi:undecaprenyl diphosphate synthase
MSASQITELQEVSRAQARYVAIVADGNRRWARARGLSVQEGHEAGADTLRERLHDAVELGVRELTVYSFSTENWSRPPAEVEGLVEMLARRIALETPDLHARGVRMRFLGARRGAYAQLIERMEWAEALTASNRRMTLYVAFDYGGRAEIVRAARRFAAKRVAQAAEGGQAGPLALQSVAQAAEGGQAGPLALQSVAQAAEGGQAGPPALQSDEEEFRRLLYAPEMHDPELIVRTGGEQRLSNYLLWQSAYSELVFREELWPDFSRASLEQSLRELGARNRRFGGRSMEAEDVLSH